MRATQHHAVLLQEPLPSVYYKNYYLMELFVSSKGGDNLVHF